MHPWSWMSPAPETLSNQAYWDLNHARPWELFGIFLSPNFFCLATSDSTLRFFKIHSQLLTMQISGPFFEKSSFLTCSSLQMKSLQTLWGLSSCAAQWNVCSLSALQAGRKTAWRLCLPHFCFCFFRFSQRSQPSYAWCLMPENSLSLQLSSCLCWEINSRPTSIINTKQRFVIQF